MTNQNDKLQQLLEWVEYGHIKQQHEDVRDQEIEDFVPVKDLINKVQSLISSPITDKESIVEPSDWRAGDRVLYQNSEYDLGSINENTAKIVVKRHFMPAMSLNVDVKEIYNIDAELRAKDAEISRLKNPWRTDLDGEQK